MSAAQEFAALYIQHYEPLLGYVRGALSWQERGEAEDIAQETFARAWAAFGTFVPDSPTGWLYTIARNIMRDRHKARRVVVDIDEHFLLSHDPAPDDTLLLARPLATLAKHNPAQYEVVRWQFFEGYGPDEIAPLMGLSSGAVRVLRHRALKNLHATIR